jgi:predicted DsbA family dithiol-disulfide isomerase
MNRGPSGEAVPPKVTVYSDYICPFCFIGKRLADRLEERFGIETEWKAFEIHPEIPRGGCDFESLGFSGGMADALLSRVMGLADEVGVRIVPPARIPNSRLALEVAEFAKEGARFREYHEAVFRAYWQEGTDIGDREQLFAIAGGAGLDPADLESYLRSGQADAKLSESLGEVLRLGIDGVPTFIIGTRKVVGAQPFEVLERAFEEELGRAD